MVIKWRGGSGRFGLVIKPEDCMFQDEGREDYPRN